MNQRHLSKLQAFGVTNAVENVEPSEQTTSPMHTMHNSPPRMTTCLDLYQSAIHPDHTAHSAATSARPSGHLHARKPIIAIPPAPCAENRGKAYDETWQTCRGHQGVLYQEGKNLPRNQGKQTTFEGNSTKALLTTDSTEAKHFNQERGGTARAN